MKQRHKSTLPPPNSMLVPYSHRHLAVAPPSTAAAARLSIPPGWGIEEVPRPDGSRSDTYYYEAGTGKKFRSIREVRRHLNGEGLNPRRSTRNLSIHNHVENSGCQRMLFSCEKKSEHPKKIVSGGKLLRLDDELSQSHLAVVPSGKATPTAPFVLPDGWIVEEVPRKYNSWTSKYYYEPGTGRKFRSLVAVERHLAELEENAPLSKALEEIKENKPLSKVFKLENLTKPFQNSKKNNCQENTQASSFIGLPMKVNWVLASSQGDAWNPFISETVVPDAVKEQWTKRFMLLMNDGKSNFQTSSS
ncbi:hypothetical protein DH2020_003010 [Rehmannia glutinosa]|uniref:MBD domain-containing protein n=1 Tax=Rehmannia glutinosa TaxID=99300 RepID=A0ABR0W3F0_REHGL